MLLGVAVILHCLCQQLTPNIRIRETNGDYLISFVVLLNEHTPGANLVRLGGDPADDGSLSMHQGTTSGPQSAESKTKILPSEEYRQIVSAATVIFDVHQTMPEA